MRSIAVLICGLLLSSPSAAEFPCWEEYPSDACELPLEFAHSTVVEEAGVRTTFASTRAEYVTGDTVEFRLQFENVGTEYFCMNWRYMPIDGVFVMPEGCNDPAAPCADEMPWSYPNTLYYAAGVGVGLDPGECRVFSYSWDTSVNPVTPGDYQVLAGLFELTIEGMVMDIQMPTGGAALPLRINQNVTVDRLSTGVLKARYR